MKRSQGYTLWSDATRVVIVTGCKRASLNRKTGNMLQVWILVKYQNPIDAVNSGSDAEICGSCAFRGPLGKRACYVDVMRAPLGIWRAWKRGRYPYLSPDDYSSVFTGRAVRWGAYGDPVNIPLWIIARVSSLASRHTGYTHQWSEPAYQGYSAFVMASCDSSADYHRAHASGWRTFRVRPAGESMLPGEISCPASDEMGKRTTCERCGLCNGARGMTDARKSITIFAHGTGAKLIQIGGLN